MSIIFNRFYFCLRYNSLGVLYLEGHGVKQDYHKAKKLFELASKKDKALPNHNLGHIYENGYGVKKDLKKAKIYYGDACEAGYQPSCKAYAILNRHGF